jgi:hypothetical protein
MGITFRSGNYIRFVRIGGRTIKDGEAAAVWNNRGVHTQIIGPRRLQLFFSTIRFLTRHKAEAHQYLVVKYRDGRVEHIRGPSEIYENPAFHDSVSVQGGTFLSSSDFIVVQKYGSEIESKHTSSNECIEITSNLHEIHGPKLFIPSPSDYVHEFSWSKVDGIKLIPAALEFSTLCDSIYPMDITLKVPLSNNNHISLALHVESKILKASVEKLLEHKDPIARMHQALQADGQILGDMLTLQNVEEWKQTEMSNIFNNVESYTELNKAAKQSGMQIKSVCLTSHTLSSELATIFNEERDLTRIQSTELKAKVQKQKITEIEQAQRVKLIEHNANLKRIQIESDAQLEKEMHAMKLESLKRKLQLDGIEAGGTNEIVRKKNDTKLLFLEGVKKLEVDMTEFLTSTNNLEEMKKMDVDTAKVNAFKKTSHK